MDTKTDTTPNTVQEVNTFPNLSDQGIYSDTIRNKDGFYVTTTLLADASGFSSKAYAYLSGGQTINSSASYTKVIFDHEVYDSSNEYDPTTGIFTVATTGFYVVLGTATWNSNASGTPRVTAILVGSSVYNNAISTLDTITNDIDLSVSVSAVVSLSATEQLSIGVSQTTGSDQAVTKGFFSVHRLS